MNTLAYVIIMIIVGSLIALQGTVNGALGKYLGYPIHAALVSFGVGFVVLLMLTLAFYRDVQTNLLFNAPPIYFIGGLLGAVYVSSVIFIIPHIGIANTVIASLLGQVVLSIILDHFGILGLEQSSFDLSKMLGVLCIAAGLVLINSKKIFIHSV